MKVRCEWVYDNFNKITTLFVWQGFFLLGSKKYDYDVDDYERDGIEETIKEQYAKK